MEAEAEPAISRTKTLRLMPMTVEEALTQMEMIQHEDFFLFLNSDTDKVTLIYKRKRGDFGQIDCEY